MATLDQLIVVLPFVEFPPTHTCDGPNTSPSLKIKHLHADSLALFALNPFEPGCSFTNWIMWNADPLPIIPANIPREPVVTTPIRALQGLNDYGEIGWRGPCPSRGELHRILFKVYGIEGQLDCPPGASKHEVIQAMDGQVLQFGMSEAIYRR